MTREEFTTHVEKQLDILADKYPEAIRDENSGKIGYTFHKLKNGFRAHLWMPVGVMRMEIDWRTTLPTHLIVRCEVNTRGYRDVYKPMAKIAI